MFVRKKKNKSGSVSIQIIDKSTGKYRVVKTVGSSSDPDQIDFLWKKAHYVIPELTGQTTLALLPEEDIAVLSFLNNSDSLKVRVVGPEKIFGKLFNNIGFNTIQDELFRHLVITRIVYPGSKLKTIDYLRRYKGIDLAKDRIYRFMDQLSNKYKEQVEQISFEHTKWILNNKIGVVFYDTTTLYFEASDEDDFRKTGFSKDGKPQNPQILLGLLVGENGYPIGYELFEGNTYEGHTFIPVLKKFEEKFKLTKPIVVADSGLLSNENISQLIDVGYQFIIGARIKNEKPEIKSWILHLKLSDGQYKEIKKPDDQRLIIGYSTARAKKDLQNRKRGLLRLEKALKKGKLTKSHINNRGYNKYLQLTGVVNISIDYEKFKQDGQWDGLKGYLTNANLSPGKIISHYNNLWHIEKAFRISKTDLKIRPIYHWIKNRIEAHICISFVAYTIIKETERILKQKKIQMSARRVAELTQTMYALDFKLPQSQKQQTTYIGLSEEQKLMVKTINP